MCVCVCGKVRLGEEVLGVVMCMWGRERIIEESG